MAEPDEPPDPLVGQTIAEKYRIDDCIGSGGMGAVYRATHVAFGKQVALKFLDGEAATDADAVARFQREAESASAVDSAHIVQIFDSGTAPDGRPYLVMELLKGEDLRARLKRSEQLDVPEVAHVAAQVLRALERAHTAGIVHRDLKPDNVFLADRDDDPMFVKIVDFGISKVSREATADTLTRKGTVLGTAFYMSPEQAQAFDDIDGRADLWSLGAILYECLAGRPPHTASTYEAVLVANCTKDPPDVRTFAPDVPEELSEVIATALARDRDERFQSARDFYEALAAALPDLVRTGSTGPTSLSPRPPSSGEPRFRTAEGTAVATGSSAVRAPRRTVVVGALIAVAAFAVTAFVMRRPVTRASAPPGVGAQPSASSSAAATREPTVTPVETTSDGRDAVDAARLERDGAPPRTATTRQVPPQPAPAHTRPLSAPAPTPAAKPAGVAEGLELDTSGP